ncbi:MAG: HNH endonuclease [Gammaproteobacteria bacterium]|nr:HNH endonuclease [Gammaproteobacteria bacterium]
MSHKMDKRIEKLMKIYGWYEGIARALIDSNGYCVFCGENLVETRLGYSSIVMDHLLPKSKYPDLEYEFHNHILSCSSCNGMKGNFDPLHEGEEAKSMLQNRQEIIDRCKHYLSKSIRDRKEEWLEIKDLLNDS